VQQHRTKSTAFTRQRKLTFPTLVAFFLNQAKGALQREIDDLFIRSLGLSHDQCVSAAAVSSARRSLKPSVFESLNARLLALIADTIPSTRWQGLRIMAVDGSMLNLPKTPAMFRAFSGQRMTKKRGGLVLPMARFSQLYDIHSDVTWHAIVQPSSLSESVAAADHLEHAPAKSLILYDRGYPSYFLAARHILLKRDFCMRIPRGFSAETDRLFKTDQPSSVFQLIPNHNAQALCKEHDMAAGPLKLRAVRVMLNTGEVEVLLTSLLDSDLIPDADFGELYALRWSVEGDFRHLKSRLQLENWTGKRVECIEQDVHARVLAKNLSTTLVFAAQAQLDAERAQKIADDLPVRKHRAKVNATAALHLCKFALVAFLLRPTLQTLEPLIAQIVSNTNAQRPGRSYPRKQTSGKSTRYPMAYKQTA